MCGIIFDPRGNIMETYAWGIGRKTNNEDEWLALYLGMELVKKENIRKVIVFGDSKQIIQKMRKGYNSGAANYKRLYERISKMCTTLHVIYYHILRKNNGLADKMADQGVKNKLGIVSIRDKHHHKYVP